MGLNENVKTKGKDPNSRQYTQRHLIDYRWCSYRLIPQMKEYANEKLIFLRDLARGINNIDFDNNVHLFCTIYQELDMKSSVVNVSTENLYFCPMIANKSLLASFLQILFRNILRSFLKKWLVCLSSKSSINRTNQRSNVYRGRYGYALLSNR